MHFRCPRCKKLVTVALCLCQLASVSPPVEIENWRFVQTGSGPTTIQAPYNSEPGLPPRMIFNADSTSTATDDGGSPAIVGRGLTKSVLLHRRSLIG